MRAPLFRIILFMLVITPLQAQQKLWLVDPLEPLFPDSNNTAQYAQKYEANFPSGTSADVHLLLNVQPGDSFTISATFPGNLLLDGCWSEMIDVPVEQNTGLDSRTEEFTGQKNPYVIRRAPFRIYEAIQPLTSSLVVARNAYTALRLSIPAEGFPGPGRRLTLVRPDFQYSTRLPTVKLACQLFLIHYQLLTSGASKGRFLPSLDFPSLDNVALGRDSGRHLTADNSRAVTHN